MSDSPFKVFSIVNLGPIDRMLSYNDSLFLVDNMGIPMSSIDITEYSSSDSPFKSEYFIAMLLVRGEMELSVNMFDYQLGPGDVVVALPGSLGMLNKVSCDAEIVMLAFSDDKYFEQMQPEYSVSFQKYFNESAVMHLSAKSVDYFLRAYNLIRDDVSDPDFQFKDEAIFGHMQVLISHACQWFYSYSRSASKQEEEVSRSGSIYMQFVKLVTQHHSKERSVAFYAENLHLSPKYMSQVIFKMSGKYPLEIIRDFVIFEAKALLRSRRYTVNQVADLLNFSNASFFGKYFRQAVGCTPRQYMLDLRD